MKKKIFVVLILTTLILNSCINNSETIKTDLNEIITSSEIDDKGNKLEITINRTKNTAILKFNSGILALKAVNKMHSESNYINEHYQYTNWHDIKTLKKDGIVIFQTKKKRSSSRSNISDFEGVYLDGKKEGGNYWIEVTIKNLKNQNSCRILVDSKRINERKGCEFNKIGILKNDTIFIKTTDWKRPVTVIITKKMNKITIDAIEKETDDRFVLAWYCLGGGSLIGDYVKNHSK